MGFRTVTHGCVKLGLGVLVCWALSGCGGSAETARLRDALYAGELPEIEAALAAGADPNGLDDDGNSFLLYALYSEDGGAVRALLANGANLELPGMEESALVIASNMGDDVALAVLDHGGTWRPDEEPALLAEAAQWAPATTVRLLEMGIDPNATMEDRPHPMVLAASAGQVATYQALRDGGAVAPQAELIEAVFSGGNQEALAAVLADHPDASLPESWFSQAVEMEWETLDREWLEGMVARYGSPSQTDLNSALAGVAYRVDPAALNTMITMGGQVGESDAVTNLVQGLEGARDERGASSQSDFEECLDALQGVGLELNAVNEQTTAIEIAAGLLEADAVKALLERGADPNGVPSQTTQRPLVSASRALLEELSELADLEEDEERPNSVGPQVIAALLSAGADPNLANEKGVYALHYAAAASSVEAVRELLGAGADASLKNAKGLTAADLARKVIAGKPLGDSRLGELAMRVTGVGEFFEEWQRNAQEVLELLGEPGSLQN